MAKRISQETFDDVVQEHIMEFDMDPEVAVKEAIQQFESQGVDLTNIVKTRPKASACGDQEPKHEILQMLDALHKSVDSAGPQEVAEHLVCFSEQCWGQVASRSLAAEKDAYPVVLAACQRAMTEDQGFLVKALNALATLTEGQPDLLDPKRLQLLAATLKEHLGVAEMTCSGLRCIRNVCLKHEQNRQNLVRVGILPLLTGAIKKDSDRASVVKQACSTLRITMFDDDIRVPFGHAPDHAKMIVQENRGLKILIESAKAFPDNPILLGELCGTLSRLAVRNEFCREIVDLGGLHLVVTLLADCIDHQELVGQVLGALRAIAGNDDVKDAIVSAGGTDFIVMAMNRHLSSPQICEQSCAALCMLALRKPANSQVIIEGGGSLAALQAMKAHPKEVSVQKQACLLIRNLVACTQAFSQPILDMGAEKLIMEARATHRECDDVAKAAL